VTPWHDVWFPFENALRGYDVLRAPVVRRADGPEIVETYALGSEGAVSVTVADASDGYARTFTLRR
jgi:hypothetical protein